MAGGPIRISVLADTKDLGKGLSSAEKSMQSAAATAEKSAGKIESSFSTAAEGADHVASKGAQAAGALSGIGGLAQSAGGTVGALGTAMTVAGIATQGLADAGDLLNVVTESTIVKSAIAKASWLADVVVKGASTAATVTLTAATTALGVAIDVATGPIGLIVLSLGALVGAVVLTVKHFDDIKATAQKVFGAVSDAAQKAIDWVKDHWPLLLGILTGPFGLAATEIIKHWDTIWDNIKALPGKITGLGGDMLTAGEHLADKLISGITSIGGQAADIAKGIVNKMIDLLNSILPHSLNTHIPGVGTVTLIPKIPHLATGGITNGPTLALIGDNASGRERVTPLDSDGLDAGQRALLDAMDTLIAQIRALVKGQDTQSVAFSKAVMAGANLTTSQLTKAWGIR